MDLIYLIGAFDACVIALLGLTGAGITLLGKEADVFWNRVVPACGILIGTSAAAGVVMAITRWLTGA
jgi:hypothetical protein